MSNEIVKYDNLMNELSFKGFEQRDFDLFMALCSRMRDLGEEEQVFEYSYLMELIEWDKNQSVERFHRDLKRMNQKLLSINASIILDEEKGKETEFVLFYDFTRCLADRTLTVSVNKKFIGLLNDLSRNFTRFELKEYVGLDSRYTKQLYVQIRQRYKLKGHYWQPSIEELRKALSIPEKLKTKYINDEIIKPAVKTIRSCKGFKELEVEVIKAPRRGRPVVGYNFTWTAKDQTPGQMNIFDYDAEQNRPAKKKRTLTQKKAPEHNFEERDYDFKELEKKFARN